MNLFTKACNLFAIIASVYYLCMIFKKIIIDMEFTAQQIADYLQGVVEGDPHATVTTFNKIEEGKPGGISFLANPKYTQYIYQSKASIVLVNKDFVAEKPISATLVRVDDAYAALAKLMQLAVSHKARRKKIECRSHVAFSAKIGKGVYVGAFSYISKKAVVGKNTQIYPQVYVGENVKIGDNCIIYPGVKIYHDCVIGNNCILHSGVIIGADGFGFAPQEDGSYKKIPQMGNVVLEDDVEIGANATVDRATMGSTIVHKGVKLDNLNQIAHNVEVGEHTVMAAMSGIAGSSKVGKNCIIAGQVGIAGHLHIADKTTLAAQTGVISDIKDNSTPWFGSPAMPMKGYLKSYTLFRKFPDIYKELQQVKKELNELKNKQQ